MSAELTAAIHDQEVRIGPAHPDHPDHDKYWDKKGNKREGTQDDTIAAQKVTIVATDVNGKKLGETILFPVQPDSGDAKTILGRTGCELTVLVTTTDGKTIEQNLSGVIAG